MTKHDGGKGDAQRPLSVDKDEFDKNWDEIFNKPQPKNEQCINYEIEADNDHVEILATIPFGK